MTPARFASALLALTLVAACGKAKPGDKCDDNGRRTCLDGKTALYCAAGAWQVDTCKKGCTEANGQATCDLTENVEGDPCPPALEGVGACRTDRASRAVCARGKYVVEPCRGPDGCTMQQAGLSSCDRSNTRLGDRCTVDPRIQLCADDGKAFARCTDGVVTLGQKCPGKRGCKDEGGGRVSCDPTGGFAEGDACHFVKLACSVDGRVQLSCEDGTFKRLRVCPGPGGCLGALCDQGTATPGDPCVGKEACSADGTSLLSCKRPKQGADVGDVWTVEKKCKTACKVANGAFSCD